MKKPLWIILSLLASTAFAQTKPIILNAQESNQLRLERTQILATLQESMVSKFTEIESRLAQGEAPRALSLAKEVLDTVRVKTGIDPKNRIQENFLAATVFPKNARSMNELTEEQRTLVINTVTDFRGGLYLDIMNLSKRTSLLYIKALQLTMERSGGLTNEDKEKIVNDLVKASLIPMPIVDKKGSKIFAFDEDIANEDHTYLFNRELKMFLIDNSQVRITERMFEEKKSTMRKSLLNSLAPQVIVAPRVTDYSKAVTCIENTFSISDYSSSNSALKACFYKYYRGLSTIQECTSVASAIRDHSDNNRAQVECSKKFQ